MAHGIENGTPKQKKMCCMGDGNVATTHVFGPKGHNDYCFDCATRADEYPPESKNWAVFK